MKLVVLNITFLLIVNVYSQNLVPNCDFELVSTCNVLDQQQSAQAIELWSGINSADYFNTCFQAPLMQAPNCYSGFANPYCGEGMAGIALIPFSSYREGVSIELLSPLEEQKLYYYSFWVKNSESDGLTYATPMIDCAFSQDTLSPQDLEFSNDQTNECTSEIHPVNWSKFSGVYLANGSEQYFTISYFGDMEFTTNSSSNQHGLYYYIDSVQVIEIDYPTLELPNVFTPNGDSINDLFSLNVELFEKVDVYVFNRWGSLVFEYDATKQVWDGHDFHGQELVEGVYFVRAIGTTKIKQELEVDSFVHLIR